MRIIVDAFGGDNSPEVPIKAAISAAKEIGCEIILLGDQQKITSLLSQYGCNDKRIKVAHAPQIISNEEKPANAVREKKESSIVVGMNLLKSGEGEAFVSAGSTGAIVAASLFNVGRIKGVRRPALAAVLPSIGGKTLLLDCGANTQCKTEDLLCFALMGSIYMRKIEGVENPTVALLSNGTEEGKGDSVVKEAYEALEQSGLNFVGNLEGRNINLGGADVIVCDGFAGNVALKSIEGCAKMISRSLKDVLYKNFKTKIGALLLKKELSEFSDKFNYKQYGGAPFLGIKAPVIKAHGSSDEKSFFLAIRQACDWVEKNVNQDISEAVCAKDN